MIICIQNKSKEPILCVSKKVGGNEAIMMRWKDDSKMKKKSHTCGQRKICSLSMLQHSLCTSLKTQEDVKWYFQVNLGEIFSLTAIME